MASATTLCAALNGLGDALECLQFTLLADDRARLQRARDRLRRDIDGHCSRLRRPDAPLLVVVGGVTGGGKSTLTNTLAGQEVAATGVRRPTTSVPTLVCHPDDSGWFDDDQVLAGIERVHGSGGLSGAPGGTAVTAGARGAPAAARLRVVAVPALPAGLALLDAPDSDSVSSRNRELADALLDAADVWLWVTTQGKYADEDSMALLRRARDRRAALATALTHVDPAQLQTLVDDFEDKLEREGLGGLRLFAVPRCPVEGGQLPEYAVHDLRGWLWSLADPRQRDAMRDRTLQGALDTLPAEVGALLEAVDAEHRTYRALTAVAAERYRLAQDRFAQLLEQGQISMREQVLTSWVAFIGTGRFQRLLQSATERVRDLGRRILGPVPRQQRLQEDLRVEAADAVAARVQQVADVAAGETADAWLRDPAGRELLDRHPQLHRSGSDLAARAREAVAAWEQELVGLVETQGASRKVRAQWASTVVNATAASLMIAAFSATGGLSGAEVGIAGTSAAVTQLLLERILGAQNVRWLVAEAKNRLLARIGAVLHDERERFTAVAAGAAPDPEDRQRVVEALEQVQRSRG